MKHVMKYLSLIVVILLSCKKQELKTYQDDPGVYFTIPTYSYSFTENITATSKTIYLPVKLSGNAQGFDRSFKIEVVKDSNTTAETDLYEIKDGELLKNNFDGRVPVVLKRSALLDSTIVKLRVKMVGSPSLDPMLTHILDISWTAKIIQPTNWNRLKLYFGAFSTAWYMFMLDAAGVSSFPYEDKLAPSDPITWWWTSAMIVAYQAKVREALNKYNADHPGDELRHNDGTNKGQLVTMP